MDFIHRVGNINFDTELEMFCFPVPIGSIRDLPGETCGEIQASEGAQAVSGKYWLNNIKLGIPVLTHCNMTSKGKFTTLSLGCLYVLAHYDMKTKVELGYNINLGIPVLINCNMATKGE